METADEKITLGLSLFLSEIVNALLYEEKEVDGKKVTAERKLPFRLKYRLVRNKASLDHDTKIFNDKKLYLLAKYGEPTEDGQSVAITNKENYEKYQAELAAVFETPITHNIMTLEPEDIDLITEDIPISVEATSLFSGYMMNDPKLYEDLLANIEFKLPEFKEPEKKKEGDKKPVTAKKTTTKKTTSTKKAPEKKETTTKKTTSTKKVIEKKVDTVENN